MLIFGRLITLEIFRLWWEMLETSQGSVFTDFPHPPTKKKITTTTTTTKRL